MPPSISVIIPTYNRSEVLALTLPSYLKSSLVREIWLVDDCSSPQDWSRTEQFSRLDGRVKCVRNDKNLGAPASRNKGIALANGELLLLSEDDLELGDNHLETLVAHMEQTQADMIAGRRLWMRIGETKQETMRRSQNRRRPIIDYRWMDLHSDGVSQEDVEVPLISATKLMRRTVAEQVRYYEPYGGPNSWRDESDFQLQAVRLGFKLVFCPHAASFHHARASISFGTKHLRGDLQYLSQIFRNNRIFLTRHQEFLEKQYPLALILKSPTLTSLFYLLRQTAWLTRSEGLRWYLGRKYKTFTWK